MTRIVTEQYKCARCGNILHRRQILSFNTMLGFKPTLPELYFCENCAYVGKDLSLPPSKEQLEILESGGYQELLKLVYPSRPYIEYLMGGYLYTQLGQFEVAIHYYSKALDYADFFKSEAEMKFFNFLVEDRHQDYGLMVDAFSKPGYPYAYLYIQEQVVINAEQINYGLNSSFSIFLIVIECMRRNFYFDKVNEIITQRLMNEKDEERIRLLNEQLELSKKKNNDNKVDFQSLEK